jgi:WD40 repeat protein
MGKPDADHESIWAEHEAVIRCFEDAWKSGGRPDPFSFIPTNTRDADPLLAELVQIDLEFRFRAGERPRVEDYTARYPQLATGERLLDLIASERSHRAGTASPLREDEFVARFPELKGRLATLFDVKTENQRTAAHVPRQDSPTPTARPAIAGYEITAELGHGGMGVVYRAEQSPLGRAVAVKTVAGVVSERTRARFRREAEAMARLDHPNIVPIYEVGEWSNAGQLVPYFVMKLYPGGSLDADAGAKTPPEKHVRTVETIARAVHHAHQRGVLHRDLKPSNILLDETGEPAVADFGLAGWYDPNDPKPLTETIVGTPAFMAPEQARDPGRVTTAADVYGLGAILYHLLTGRPPIEGPSPIAILEQLCVQYPSKPSSMNPAISRDLETICLKCLEKDPMHRYASAGALADDLARLRQGRSISARRPSVWEQAWRTVRRHPIITGLTALTVLSLLGMVATLAVSYFRIREQKNETATLLDREQKALYLERVASAARLYQMNHLEQAWHTLDECPPTRRDWEWYYLDGLRRATAVVRRGHANGVVATAFLADGRVVTADGAGEVRVWANDERPTYLDVRGSMLSAHPTKNWLAVVDKDKELSVWDADAKTALFKTPATSWVGFSPDGSTLATADGVHLKLWQVGTWQPLGPLIGHAQAVVTGVFSLDSKLMFTSGQDRVVRRWDLATRTPVGKPLERPAVVQALALTADGKTLIEAMPTLVQFTDVETGLAVRTAENLTGRPCLATGPDSAAVLMNTPTGELLVRHVGTGHTLRAYRGHGGAIYSVAVSRDGSRFATGGADNTLRIWDVKQSTEFAKVADLGDRAGSLTITGDGKQLVVAPRPFSSYGEDEVRVYDPTTATETARVPGRGEAAIDHGGRWLAAGRGSGDVVIRDAKTGAELKTLATRTSITRIRFSPTGMFLALGDLQGNVRVWNTLSWAASEPLTKLEGPIYTLSWAPTGDRLAVSGTDRIEVWDVANRVLEKTIPTDQVTLALDFSPNGYTIAVAGRNRTLSLLDVRTGEVAKAFIGNPSLTNAVAFHPSASRLATAGVDGMIRLWDTDSGKELLTLDGGNSDLVGLVWSADGQRLYSSGTTLRGWIAER